MGQKLMSAEGACRDAVIGMNPDESVLILIKHCQDMKQQETRLRLITLVLLLSCTALFCFTISTVLRQTSGLSGQKSTDEQSPTYSQQSVCSTDNPQTNVQRLHPQRWHIRLRSEAGHNMSAAQYMKWRVVFGGESNKETNAIVVHKTGVYFVYVSFKLKCQNDDGFESFKVQLKRKSEGYDKTINLISSWDEVTCTSEGFRTVVVEELLDLLEQDQVSVWIEKGYHLISESSFGAFFI